MTLAFTTDHAPLQAAWDKALLRLRGNLRSVIGYDRPVLFEGAEYQGIWLECGPHECLLYGSIDPQVALDGHRVFIRHQRADGLFPAYVWADRVSYAHVQSVIPFAATALETWQLTGDDAFLADAYAAAARYDEWLQRYRDHDGCVMAFCEWDTGHDNSPRLHGLPKECPDGDANQRPEVPLAGLSAVDLTSMRLGSLDALIRMAGQLGQDPGPWHERRMRVHAGLMSLYDREAAWFYDRRPDGSRIAMHMESGLHPLREGALPQDEFNRIWNLHLGNPARWWTPFPFPSCAADDPAFIIPIPHNHWGGPSQALTALRAPRWLPRHGRQVALAHLMRQWLTALQAMPEFRQQINPWTGDSTSQGRDYSPAMLCQIDFVRRLHGAVDDGQRIVWGCTLPAHATRAQFSDQGQRRTLTINHARIPSEQRWREPGTSLELRLQSETVRATLAIDDLEILTVEGRCHIETSMLGTPLRLIGCEPMPTPVSVRWNGGSWSGIIAPDQVISLDHS